MTRSPVSSTHCHCSYLVTLHFRRRFTLRSNLIGPPLERGPSTALRMTQRPMISPASPIRGSPTRIEPRDDIVSLLRPAEARSSQRAPAEQTAGPQRSRTSLRLSDKGGSVHESSDCEEDLGVTLVSYRMDRNHCRRWTRLLSRRPCQPTSPISLTIVLGYSAMFFKPSDQYGQDRWTVGTPCQKTGVSTR